MGGARLCTILVRLATPRTMPPRLRLGCGAPESNESPSLPAYWSLQGYISLVSAFLRWFEPYAIEIDNFP